jgi:hypothetical protein
MTIIVRCFGACYGPKGRHRGNDETFAPAHRGPRLADSAVLAISLLKRIDEARVRRRCAARAT